MLIEDIGMGMLVKILGGPHRDGSGITIPDGTVGIVTAIKRDDVYVEFELGKQSTTVPTLCHPIFLKKVP